MEKIYRMKLNSKGMPNFSTAVEVEDRPQEWLFNELEQISEFREVSEDCISRQQAMDKVYKAYTRDDIALEDRFNL